MPCYRPCAACLQRINSCTKKANQNLHIPWKTRCTQGSLDTKCCSSRVFALPTNMREHPRGSAVARQYRHHSLRATPSERSSAKAPTLPCTTAVHVAAACVLLEALRHTQQQASLHSRGKIISKPTCTGVPQAPCPAPPPAQQHRHAAGQHTPQDTPRLTHPQQYKIISLPARARRQAPCSAPPPAQRHKHAAAQHPPQDNPRTHPAAA